MKKRMLSMLLAGTMAASLTACGAAPEQQKDSLHVSVILKTTASEYWKLVEAGCEKFDEEHDDVVFDIVAPDSETAYEEQKGMIKSALKDSDVDAYVISPLQSEEAAGLLEGELRPVFAVDTDIEAPEVISFIGTDNEAAAREGAEMAVAEAKKAGWETIECIEIAGVEGDATNTARMKGYQAGVEENGGTFLADQVQYANALPDQAGTCMEAILHTYPDGIAIVCTNNDDMAAAAGRAVARSHNEAYENTVFLGFDGSSDACQMILDGQLTMSVGQLPYEMGYLACEAAYDALKGDQIDPFIDSQTEVITADNAQERIDRIKEWMGK